METVVIVIHLMVVLALVLVVLLQRSEGGALGIGGGGGGGFMSSRGTANVLTRVTAILAVCFFVTSLALSLIAKHSDRPSSVLDSVPTTTEQSAPAPTTGEGNGILNQLRQQSDQPSGPQVPAAQ
ncbi:preprotein translocase subunit SecG [Roseibium sp. RKSG952]|uniref:preprotein translocase subunit SecG n=1 Tax=Roseibium sp. RKSG952 TaxID=2529384 RepID=UPI0012BCDD18|nr:preprotein translocase subunit SecG [Roseibium sp. RKSG952]MTH96223.1 preprotein translocase subunit SecG [Roseibium sp. RKSG952]